MEKPAIVVVAYNRTHSLNRLLLSLAKAEYHVDTKLIISIDKGKNRNVQQIVNDFKWQYGEKEVIYQEKNLGLRNHILRCGDLTQEYGSIILLEDDLFVSPMFYRYATEALDFYAKESAIAGISLYSASQNMFTQFPFWPIIDESDIFFLQIPQSWGEAWTRDQWLNFRTWYKQDNYEIANEENLPQRAKSWKESSWAKYFYAYMVNTDKYFVIPRESYTTQFSEIGLHTRKKSTLFQRPLQLFKSEYIFKRFDSSLAVYDPYYEILPNRLNNLTDQLKDYDYTVDLNATKPLDKIRTEYCLTPRHCKGHVFSFGKEMKPLEMNIIESISGKELFFCRKDSIRESRFSQIARRKKDFIFYYGDQSKVNLLLLFLLKFIGKI